MGKAIHQEDIIEYLGSYPNVGIMIPIHGKMPELGVDALFQCCLVPVELVEEEMKTDHTNNWRTGSPGFTEYGFGDDSEIIYHRFGNRDGFEPLVITRDFDGLGVDNEIEISEEFRILNNLYFDRAKNEYVDLENEVTVVRIKNDLVVIHKNYLKRYLAVKQKSLLVHLSSLVYNNCIDPDIDERSEPICLDGKNITISYGIDGLSNPKRNYSSIYAKMAIGGCFIDDCGYWPYSEIQREYEEFIVGVDESGNEITFSCNPDLLNDHGRKNDRVANYFELVFFKRDVLHKYYSAPKKYTVGDGFLRCSNNWILYIDNQSADYVVAYLGDLGRYLPSQKEQKHWRQYNIMIDGKLSKAKWQRDFGSIFAEPDSPVFQFQEKYQSLNKVFIEHLGWELFLPLTLDDEYNLTGLRIPVSNAQPEFDMQVLCLVKVLIDSLNEKKIVSLLNNSSMELKGSIARFEQLLKLLGVKDYEAHIRFLRDLQELRSSGTGHRKATNYAKTAKKFGLPENDFKTAFTTITKKAVDFLIFVQGIVADIDLLQSQQTQESKQR